MWQSSKDVKQEAEDKGFHISILFNDKTKALITNITKTEHFDFEYLTVHV